MPSAPSGDPRDGVIAELRRDLQAAQIGRALALRLLSEAEGGWEHPNDVKRRVERQERLLEGLRIELEEIREDNRVFLGKLRAYVEAVVESSPGPRTEGLRELMLEADILLNH